jgi:hypothetical protein
MGASCKLCELCASRPLQSAPWFWSRGAFIWGGSRVSWVYPVSRFFGRASVLLLIREHLQREKKAVDARFYTYKGWNLAVLRMNTYMNLVGSGYCHTRISINQSNISLPKKLVFNVLLKWRQYQNKEKYSAIMARGRKTSGIDSCERTSKRSRCIGDGEGKKSYETGSNTPA